MKRALAKIQKTEINTYIDEFVKARQKYFTDGQEWLEAKVIDEKIYVQVDRKQLEEELDDMIKISLQFGKVLPLEMKIQVRKVAGGAENQLHGQRCRKLEVRPDLCTGESWKRSFCGKKMGRTDCIM